MTDFDAFRAAVETHRPESAIVLGSGLGSAADTFKPTAIVRYSDLPGLVAPTVRGHGGRLAVGHWAGVPAVIAFGRVHFYEGHPWHRVTALIQLLKDFGIRSLLLTNAAGGIRSDLGPNSLMVIEAHLKLVEPDGWKQWPELASPYSARLNAQLRRIAASQNRALHAGNYASLTGPCYETPAEIRALRSLGADAVGMSTAVEAEAAAGIGLEVAGLSCITNWAAGLSVRPLSHSEVEITARNAVNHVADLLRRMVAEI